MNINHLTFDPFTNRPFYHINTEEQLKLFKDEINPNKTLIGIYHNEARFLTKNSTLVKYSSIDVLKIYSILEIKREVDLENYVSFNLNVGHAEIDFSHYNYIYAKKETLKLMIFLIKW